MAQKLVGSWEAVSEDAWEKAQAASPGQRDISSSAAGQFAQKMTSAAYDVRLLQQGALRGSEIQQAARAGAVKAETVMGEGSAVVGKNEKDL